MKNVFDFLDGKKRGIAAILGALTPWIIKYHVLPDQWLDLYSTGLGLFATYAVGHAIYKSSVPRDPPQAP